jgi:ABC-type multidrug transport system ATPase subunit/pSer/pThr/pTyr-binding forkhead associated (FHA) protein
MKIVFVEESVAAAGPTTAFERGEVTIGRDVGCDWAFDQGRWPMVSRRHARLTRSPAGWRLEDAGSSLGTFVNGTHLIGAVTLKAGDRIQLGVDGPVLRVVSVAGEALDAGAVRPVELPASGAWLEVLGAAGEVKEIHPLARPTTTLGRDVGNDVVLASGDSLVSRRHAEIQRDDGGGFRVVDRGSRSGTQVNGQDVAGPTPLRDGDTVSLGEGGPELRLRVAGPAVEPMAITRPMAVLTDPSAAPGGAAPGAPAPAAPAVTPKMPARAQPAGIDSPAEPKPSTSGRVPPPLAAVAESGSTLLVRASAPAKAPDATDLATRKALLQRRLDGEQPLAIGRAATNDIALDALQISNRHARVRRSGGVAIVEDLGSTNGTYVNGRAIGKPTPVREDDVVQIGPFALRVDGAGTVTVFDTRAETRIDVFKLGTEVRSRGRGALRLLDGIDLAIEPNEFVGLLGPSGAGKSTLMNALNGMRPATEGNVLINGLDLYRHLDLLKQGIGYVPQDDIIHRELTVARTLQHVARLRLAEDATGAEVERLVAEVMSLTGLAERAQVPVAQLSGGQRKRVSIAVELITKPSVIFLDEPTSGLDPGTEDKVMRLFREIAESGRTVILTTHAMENVRLFDKIVLLMRGRLVFYGAPLEALAHVDAQSFHDLYDRLEAPIEARLAGKLAGLGTAEQQRLREQVADEVATEWQQKFLRTPQHRANVAAPLETVRPRVPAAGDTGTPRRHGPGALRQFATLTRRYAEVLGRDRLNLLILLAQAPLIGVLTWLVTGPSAPRDFAYFIMAVVAMWFGTSVAAREIIRERAIYTRERMVGMGLVPYLGSKLGVLGVLVGAQTVLLFGTLKLVDAAGLVSLPGLFGGLPQLGIMLLTALVGIGAGLLVSALVKTSEMATSLVPLILIPQILFAGLVGVPEGLSRVVGLTMPTTWAYDGIKRYSGLDTLEAEGSDPFGPNRGRGLYRRVEQANEASVKRARDDLARYRTDAERQLESYKGRMEEYLKGGVRGAKPDAPKLAAAPSIADARRLPQNLDGYVSFLHPWMNRWLIPAVLAGMFVFLAAATLAVLRSQDIRRKRR